jgi:hypothetical protein
MAFKVWSQSRVIILEFNSPKDIAQDRFLEELKRGLEAVEYNLVTPQEKKRIFQKQPKLSGCFSQTCLYQIGTSLKVGLAIRADIKVKKNHYKIILRVFETVKGKEVLQIEETCEECSFQEALEAINLTGSSLRAKLKRDYPYPKPKEKTLFKQKAPWIAIKVSPLQAKIKINGITIGKGKIKKQLKPGQHEIKAELKDYLPQIKRVKLSYNERLSLLFKLKPKPKPLVPKSLLWTGLGVGTSLIITGGILLSIDGIETCDGPGVCPYLYDTLAGGGITLGIGVALTATAIGFFLLEWSK